MTLRRISFVVIRLFFLFLSFASFQDGTMEEDQPPPHPHQPPYWLKIKALFTSAQSYLFPPNLDFGGSNNGGIEGVAGDKVKEAIAKRLGKCKAIVEESAKSAAKKLKDTLSSQPHHEPHDV